MSPREKGATHEELPAITFSNYKDEVQLSQIKTLIDKDLSEPYSVYSYRYFLHTWGKQFSFLATIREPNSLQDRIIGAVICKQEYIEETRLIRGYIGMLAVDKDYRNRSVGTTLVKKCVQAMLDEQADLIVLEAEVTNSKALRLYEKLGFIRYEKLNNYYLNGVDAFRLILFPNTQV